ncbi:Diphthamide biosynthesis protein 4 [Moelleriella libera RCEF 2490]|uniref:Diphthamide biosynthesis protein 4 n=1 Tax=Moelleriella libera RCEF 2490 TaxID=1081109 RepID=A0A166VJY5_9HYPO|nr:Diphthamide biosynthesis protein 4 [Moelleriella libera RCEF 2490]
MGADASLPGQQAATHYAVLALAPSMLNEATTTTTTPSSSSSSPSYSLVRKAYHRALLLHHPDKHHHHSQPNRTTTTTTSTRTSSSSSSLGGPLYTIDQIATAFAVLSSPQRRADYDALLQQHSTGTGTCSHGSSFFPTGVENVDLDDVAFDEDAERWYASCRCGNGRGYLFAERDLVLVEDEGVLMVACQDCSLWLRVHFAVLQRDDEDDDDDGDVANDDDDVDDQDNMGHGDAEQR